MENEILIQSADNLREKLYVIRGVQVMLDRDLAEIYGYTVKAFNQQVKNNIEKFAEDFRFQLTDEEAKELSRSNFLTLNEELIDLRSNFLTANISPMSRSNPYAFTEQGIYMLMTVLKGDLATRQSISLIRLFKQMKDTILKSQNILLVLNFFRLLYFVTSASLLKNEVH